MPEKMIRFSEINWVEVGTIVPDAIEFCLSREVAAYIKVREDLSVFCYFSKNVEIPALADVGGPVSFPFKGFDDEIAFLRIDNTSLAKIVLSGNSVVREFLHGGFAIRRPRRVIGHSIARRAPIIAYDDIKVPSLEKVEFTRALLIDKSIWDSAVSTMTTHRVEEFAAAFEFNQSDVYFLANDIETMKKAAQRQGLASYPFKHQERMPGVYWMYQAAYAFNKFKIISRAEDIGNWLIENAPKNTYRFKSIVTARNFVRVDLDRGKGGKSRHVFVPDELADWTDKKSYVAPEIIGPELSFVLAIADWWDDVRSYSPDESNLTLAKKLDEQGFSGTELHDLVFIMSRSKLSKKDILLFEAHLNQREIEKKAKSNLQL